MNMAHGRLLAIEGVDGSGKNTQARLLVDALRARGGAAVVAIWDQLRAEGFFADAAGA